MKEFIKLEKIGQNAYSVYYYNGTFLGEIYMEVDGFYVFWFKKGTSGFWESHALRAIADKLDEMNEDWVEQINNDPLLNEGL